MRAAPSLVQNSGTNYYFISTLDGYDYLDDFILNSPSTTSALLYNSSDAAGTAGNYARFVSTTNGQIAFDSEL
jgi:hypothetical protein